ncbi:MAG: hypothetical protein PHI23_01795 [Candidatus Peribacteraceae bacterium]|nr:hypothetical protein [Candidatus Peribacteraceae bacterium]
MKHCLLRAIGIVTLALLGSACLLILVIITMRSMEAYTRKAEDYLPAQETVALFSHTEQATLERFALWLPLTTPLPVTSENDLVALVDLPGREHGTVIFHRRSDGPTPAAEDRWWWKDLGPFAVGSSTQKVYPLLTATENRLGKSATFSALSALREHDTTWTYLVAEPLPPPTSLGDHLLQAALLSGVTHFGITTAGNGDMRIDLFGSSQKSEEPITPRLRLPFPATFLSLTASRIGERWKDMTETLGRARALTAESSLITIISSLFGEDVSFREDLLPLLAPTSTLHLGRTASGNTVFLIEGTVREETDLPHLIERIHSSFASSLKTTKIVTRSFDKGRFTSRNIRVDTNLLHETTDMLNGWQIRTTAGGDDASFTTAMKGTMILLSNAPEAVKQITREEESLLTLPMSSSLLSPRITAGGFLHLPAIQLFFGRETPSLLRAPSPFLPQGSDGLLWSLEEGEKEVRTLRLQTDPSPEDRST